MIFAIIHPDTLAATGLRHLLQSYFDVQAHCYATPHSFLAAQPEQYDGYMVASEAFMPCSEVLLPRKARVVLLCNRSEHLSWGGMSLLTTLSHEEIIEALDSCIEQLSTSREPRETQEELTLREIEVLRCVAQGKMNKEIADVLHISINTVLSHRKNIVAKLGIKTVSGLSLYAVMNGIIAAGK